MEWCDHILCFFFYIYRHVLDRTENALLCQVVRHLIAMGHEVHVVTAAPDFVFTREIQSPNLYIRKVLVFFLCFRIMLGVML